MDLPSVPTLADDVAPGEALLPSPGLLRAMLQNTSDIIHVLDAEGRIRYISPSVERVLGYAPEELIGRLGHDLVHPDDLASAEQSFEHDIRRPNSTRRFELRLCHRDESWRAFEVFGRIVEDAGGDLIAIVTSHDVTERKRAEEALRTSNETLGSLITAAPLPVFSLDLKGRVRTWNPAAERVFGWRAKEVIGRMLPIVPDRWRGEFLLLRERMVRGETLSREETTRERKDGTAIEVGISAAPIRNASGEVRGLIAVLEDITERKLIERHRAQVLQFVGHDLRTPLTCILLNADLLASSLDESERSGPDGDSVRAIIHSAKQMEELIRDVSDMGRTNAGGLSLARELLSTEALLRDALTVLQPLARDRSIRIELDPAPDVRVRADRDRLLQVISNLVTNALRFTPAGGRITLQVEPLEDEVLFSVRDTGCGIAEADLPYVFDRYWQAKPRHAGTSGLGLAIVKGIIEGHGGRVWAESRVGTGSTFFFALPRAAESPFIGSTLASTTMGQDRATTGGDGEPSSEIRR